MPSKIFISKFTDPFINLSIEDFLFRHVLSNSNNNYCPSILFLYQNDPTVVIGRAQNPWLETNFPWIKENKINLIRRQSGGGTVYHDLGNLNYSFLALTPLYQVDQHLRILIDALANLGLDAHANKRHDLYINEDGTEKKISGSAFRKASDRAFHHATLLIDSNLDNLIKAISSDFKIDQSSAKGVKSVRSKVANLNQLSPNININSIIKVIIEEYKNIHQIEDSTIILENQSQIDNDIIQNSISDLKEDKWLFEKTLTFAFSIELKINKKKYFINCNVNHGKIIDFTPKSKLAETDPATKPIKTLLMVLNKHVVGHFVYDNIRSTLKNRMLKQAPEVKDMILGCCEQVSNLIFSS
jgi:lipoate---protein ligase